MTCRAGNVVLHASIADVTEALTLQAAGGCVSMSLTQGGIVLCGCRLYSADMLAALQQVLKTCADLKCSLALIPCWCPHAWTGRLKHAARAAAGGSVTAVQAGACQRQCLPDGSALALAAAGAPAALLEQAPAPASAPSAAGSETSHLLAQPYAATAAQPPPPWAVPANHKYRPAGRDVPVLASYAPPPTDPNQVCGCAAAAPRSAPTITLVSAGASPFLSSLLADRACCCLMLTPSMEGYECGEWPPLECPLIGPLHII